MNNFDIPTDDAQKEALNHANGYVYVIDEKYKNNSKVPPSAIAGAWKVNNQGLIEGEFIPNPNYKSNN